jgi:hypothetical protein
VAQVTTIPVIPAVSTEAFAVWRHWKAFDAVEQ